MDVFSLVATLELQADNFFSGLADAAQAMIDFAADSVKTGAEFDASMSRVSAVALTNVKFTDQQFASLKETAQSMGYEFEETADRTETAFNILRSAALATGASTKFTATEAASALNYMGMAGWNAQEMLEGLPGVIALSASSGADLGRTSDIVTDALTAFGMGADQAADFADLLAITSARANTNVDMMGDTFKYVASVAGAYNITAEDTALAIGLMANRGIKASQAGTALRNVFSRLATDAGASAESLGALGIVKEMGVDFYDAEGKVRDFSEFLTELRGKWRDLDPQTAAEYAKKIAGMYGMSGFLGLMNATDEEVAQLQEDIANRAGAAQTMMDTIIDNLAGDMTIFESAVQSAQIAIADKLTPTLREFVQYGATGIQQFEHALRYQGLDSAMDVLVGMVEGGADMLEQHLPEWEQKGTQILSALSRGMEKAAPVIGEVVGVLGNMAASFLSENSGTIANITASLVKAFIPAGLAIISGIGEGIRESWPEISDALSGLLGEVMPELQNWARENIPIVGNLIADMLQTGQTEKNIQNALTNTTFGSTGATSGMGFWERFNFLNQQGTNAIEEYNEILDSVPETTETTANADTSGAISAVNDLIDAINNIPTDVTVNVSGNYSGADPNGISDARSMSGGTILRGATMFGWDNNGIPHIGGGEGAEAVVGVNSLHQMIHESVTGAVSSLMNGLGGMIAGGQRQPAQLVL
ncbi:MAG: phage tail tape measure protein, partial [Clostridia bacterium]|nr:phage tail tape measure protein [Clostridia bacterium]